MTEEQEKTLQELVDQAQELDMGYKKEFRRLKQLGFRPIQLKNKKKPT